MAEAIRGDADEYVRFSLERGYGGTPCVDALAAEEAIVRALLASAVHITDAPLALPAVRFSDSATDTGISIAVSAARALPDQSQYPARAHLAAALADDTVNAANLFAEASQLIRLIAMENDQSSTSSLDPRTKVLDFIALMITTDEGHSTKSAIRSGFSILSARSDMTIAHARDVCWLALDTLAITLLKTQVDSIVKTPLSPSLSARLHEIAERYAANADLLNGLQRVVTALARLLVTNFSVGSHTKIKAEASLEPYLFEEDFPYRAADWYWPEKIPIRVRQDETFVPVVPMERPSSAQAEPSSSIKEVAHPKLIPDDIRLTHAVDVYRVLHQVVKSHNPLFGNPAVVARQGASM
jgi:hypothetical protein